MRISKFLNVFLKRNYMRLRRLTTQTTPTAKTVKAGKVPPKKNAPTEMDEYFSSKEDLAQIKSLIPLKYFKRYRKPSEDIYLIDACVAEEISSCIAPFLLKSKSRIIENNPGVGLLTKKLLQAGVPYIRLFESNQTFYDNILELSDKYPGRIHLSDGDLFTIWRQAYQDRHDNGNRIQTLLKDIESKHWDDDPAMTIIGAMATSNFLRHCMLSLIFQFSLMTFGRCEFYVSIPPAVYLQLTAGPNSGYVIYRSSSVLFQTLCDFEILTKFPRKSFVPWDAQIINKIHKIPDTDIEYFYFTRITFKKELPVPMQNLQMLWHFVSHLMLSRKTKFIPSLEKWIPGCGERIIKYGIDNDTSNTSINISIFTQIGELNPTQIVNLFNTFSSWPEFSESTFIPSMEAAILKMVSSSDLSSSSNIEGNEGKEDDTEENTKQTDKIVNKS